MGAATGLRRGAYASSTLAEPRLPGQLGRRRLEDTDADKVEAIVAARAAGTGIRRIARYLGWAWELCYG
jgi:hypothetical protein